MMTAHFAKQNMKEEIDIDAQNATNRFAISAMRLHQEYNNTKLMRVGCRP